jgi:hypothetical protein
VIFGKVLFSIEDYIEIICEEPQLDMSGEAATPEANQLFKTKC